MKLSESDFSEDLFIFKRQGYRELGRKSEQERFTPQISPTSRGGQAEARRVFLVSHVGARAQALKPSSVAFQGKLAGNLIRICTLCLKERKKKVLLVIFCALFPGVGIAAMLLPSRSRQPGEIIRDGYFPKQDLNLGFIFLIN